MSAAIQPFDPRIPDDEVERLFRKLADTRLPTEPIVPDAGADYGPSLEWVHKLYDYWLNKYDWKKAQEKISAWKHFTTEIEGLKVHFVHESARVRKENAVPLLLVHGWPGTFYEFQNVMDPLLSPENDSDPSFDLVVVSLPGFCWSQGPPRDWTLQDTARIYDQLMKRLGYAAYVAQAGDWGHWVVRELGTGNYNACKAIHTNMCPASLPEGVEPTASDKRAKERMDWWLGKPLHEAHMGYAVEMRTRPQTIGVAFNDNPVGIMMFVGEKYNELVDPKNTELEDEAFNDDICTTLSLYFFTPPSIMTSMLCYTFNVRHEVYDQFNAAEENLVRVPMGVSSFAYDACPSSERAVRTTTTNLQFFKERDRGGHFACMECPKEMVSDLREFFGQCSAKW